MTVIKNERSFEAQIIDKEFTCNKDFKIIFIVIFFSFSKVKENKRCKIKQINNIIN